MEHFFFFFLLCSHPTLWRPEYGSYMIEGTPGQPYGGTMSEFNTVEDNMRQRRKEATSLLKENQALCTITSFPRLVPTWTCPRGQFGAQGYKEQIMTKHLTLKVLILYRPVILHSTAFGCLYVRATGRCCTPAPVGGDGLEPCGKGCVWAWWERPGGPLWPGSRVEAAAHPVPGSSDLVRNSESPDQVLLAPSHVFAYRPIRGHLLEGHHQCPQGTIGIEQGAEGTLGHIFLLPARNKNTWKMFFSTYLDIMGKRKF